MENNEFRKQIDELFRLFNKLMERYPMEDIPGLNRTQLEQMKIFLKNYEQMKDQLSFEVMGEVNEPMRQMIKLFIKQLREELGEEAPVEDIESENSSKPLTIEEIDKRLQQTGLSDEEIDHLLDERSRLKKSGL